MARGQEKAESHATSNLRSNVLRSKASSPNCSNKQQWISKANLATSITQDQHESTDFYF
jgi:hypothetical protein